MWDDLLEDYLMAQVLDKQLLLSYNIVVHYQLVECSVDDGWGMSMLNCCRVKKKLWSLSLVCWPWVRVSKDSDQKVKKKDGDGLVTFVVSDRLCWIEIHRSLWMLDTRMQKKAKGFAFLNQSKSSIDQQLTQPRPIVSHQQ